LNFANYGLRIAASLVILFLCVRAISINKAYKQIETYEAISYMVYSGKLEAYCGENTEETYVINFLIDLGRYNKAADRLEKLYKEDTTKIGLLLNIAQYNIRDFNYTSAEQNLRKLLNHKSTPFKQSANYYLAICYYGQNNFF
jgi:predicted Zn-dependent protease